MLRGGSLKDFGHNHMICILGSFLKGAVGLSADRNAQLVSVIWMLSKSQQQCRSSSVVERIIGNDEVGSSILPCGTIFLLAF